MNNLNEQIRSRTEAFASELSNIIQQSILQTVQSALGSESNAVLPRATVSRPTRKPTAAAARKSTPTAAGKRGRGRPPSRAIAETMETLLKHVRSNPGQRLDWIAESLGTSTDKLSFPAKKLIAQKKLHTKGQTRGVTYFPR